MTSDEYKSPRQALLHPAALLRDPDFWEALAVAAIFGVIAWTSEAFFGRQAALGAAFGAMVLYFLIRWHDFAFALFVVATGVGWFFLGRLWGENFAATAIGATMLPSTVAYLRYRHPEMWESDASFRWSVRVAALGAAWALYAAVPRASLRGITVSLYAGLYVFSELLPVHSLHRQSH